MNDGEPLPRRSGRTHLEPQLREPGGTGTGTPFAAFDPDTPDGDPTAPGTPEPGTPGRDNRGSDNRGNDNRGNDTPGNDTPGSPPTGSRAAAFRAAVRRAAGRAPREDG